MKLFRIFFVNSLLLCSLNAYELDFSKGDTLLLSVSNSPYEFNKTVIIPLGKTLIIEPGVELRLAPKISIRVEGTLIANGTNEQRIKFIPFAHGDYFDITFSAQFSKVNLTRDVCVENSTELTNKQAARAFCRELGYMGESYFFNYMNTTISSTSTSNPYIYLSQCEIKSSFLKDNCKYHYRYQCNINAFRSLHCSQPPIHNYWSGLFFIKRPSDELNKPKSVLTHVTIEKSGLNLTCCSPLQTGHGAINIDSYDLVVLSDVRINGSASNGLSIHGIGDDSAVNYEFDDLQIVDVFLNAIEISPRNIQME